MKWEDDMKGLLKTGVAVSILALCVGGAHAQGRPDLQGFWSNQSVTRMERPQGVDKLKVSEAEAIELERSSIWNQVYREQAGAVNVNEPLAAGAAAFETRGYNAFWIDPGRRLSKVKGDYRTSWVVEPASGRIPWKTGGRALVQAASGKPPVGSYNGIETRPLAERCLLSFSNAGGPVMQNGLYNNTYQFVQSPDHVMILVEMAHEARIIPIVSGPSEVRHRPSEMTPWLGDSVGWYEGETLVVETVNPNPWQRGVITASGKLTERFSRWSDDQILYEFTVEDPSLYTQPWKGEMSFHKSSEPLYEYACHEGNYAMAGILGGARAQERAGQSAGENSEVES
jgi:hypothetical protein